MYEGIQLSFSTCLKPIALNLSLALRTQVQNILLLSLQWWFFAVGPNITG